MVKAAVLGYGTVGSGIVEVIEKNADVIAAHGVDMHVKYILDLRDFPGDPFEKLVVHDIETILADDEVKVVCEAMGGVEPAFTFSKRAMEAGKSVCTSNKELVAAKGDELMKIAKENNVNYLFEASVGGGIPIIRTLNDALTAERIESIQGILNGTTNYILTKMEREGADFDGVLKEAQEKGYAERNPEADIEGYDACRKIAILVSVISHKKADWEKVRTEGITKITPEDFRYAHKLGRTIKLIAMCEKKGDGYYAMVSPRMIKQDNPINAAQDVFNAVLVHSDMLDDSLYYGRGAGKLPTASAVVGDAIEEARHIGEHFSAGWTSEEAKLLDIDTYKTSYFVRLKGAAADRKAELEGAFSKFELVDAGIDGEFGIVTGELEEGAFLKAFGSLKDATGYIRL
ncbi:MAG: homoserine dehydrogenase [Lachnospiraceae bacterium]|nr:homoserine dehydrogenase [Lachnospiraceae bacterium]